MLFWKRTVTVVPILLDRELSGEIGWSEQEKIVDSVHPECWCVYQHMKVCCTFLIRLWLWSRWSFCVEVSVVVDFVSGTVELVVFCFCALCFMSHVMHPQ
jgi:hypothetical protein